MARSRTSVVVPERRSPKDPVVRRVPPGTRWRRRSPSRPSPAGSRSDGVRRGHEPRVPQPITATRARPGAGAARPGHPAGVRGGRARPGLGLTLDLGAGRSSHRAGSSLVQRALGPAGPSAALPVPPTAERMDEAPATARPPQGTRRGSEEDHARADQVSAANEVSPAPVVSTGGARGPSRPRRASPSGRHLEPRRRQPSVTTTVGPHAANAGARVERVGSRCSPPRAEPSARPRRRWAGAGRGAAAGR